MDEEIKRRITSYLDELEKATKTTGEFVSEQAPLLVQEYLNWYFINNLFHAVICLVIAMILVRCVFKYYHLTYRLSDGDRAPLQFIIIAVTCLISGGLTIASISSVHLAIKVKIAPRVVLLEEVTSIMSLNKK